MNNTYLLLGSNEGDRREWMDKAMGMLAADYGTIIGQSSLYETAAWGITDQPAFLNMVILLSTTYNAPELLRGILATELILGRHREQKWGQRIIDIDILLFNDDVIAIPELTVPHPMMHLRRFTLVPLAEIAPDVVHPLLHQTISALLVGCADKLDVKRIV